MPIPSCSSPAGDEQPCPAQRGGAGKFFGFFAKRACFFRPGVLVYTSCSGQIPKNGIRVWRSLVSRLNGVQEALSSNLSTRTNNLQTVESQWFAGFFLSFSSWMVSFYNALFLMKFLRIKGGKNGTSQGKIRHYDRRTLRFLPPLLQRKRAISQDLADLSAALPFHQQWPLPVPSLPPLRRAAVLPFHYLGKLLCSYWDHGIMCTIFIGIHGAL